MSDILLAKYNDNEINLHLVPAEAFETGKSKYHIKWTFTFGSREQWFDFELTPSTSQIPAARICGPNPDSEGDVAWFTIFTAPELRATVYMQCAASLITHTGVASFELVDSGGDHMIDMARWYQTALKQFIGTVSDCNLDIKIEADFPIFATDWELNSVLQVSQVGDAYKITSIASDQTKVVNCVSGDMSAITDAANYLSEVDTIPRDKRYYINNFVRKNGTLVSTKRYEFMIPPGAKIGFVLTQNPHDPEGLTHNMSLHIDNYTSFLYRIGGTGDSWSEGSFLTLLDSTVSRYYYGEWTDYNNGDFYKASCDTNIPIWPKIGWWESYLEGKLTEEDAENGGELSHHHPTTGADLDSSDITSPKVGASGIGCNVWALSKTDLKDIANVLYDDTQTVIDDIQKGTWLWGNNPMDFIISCYYVPLDISDFYDVNTGRDVYFGSYDSGLDKTQINENKESNRITLCQTPIESVYGDYRDVTLFKYELFLPFIGFIPLNIQAFLDKMLTVELAFDVMTHNIRYYIYADGIIQDRIDGSVGYDIPLMATDQVNKAKSDIQGVLNMFDVAKDVTSLAKPSVSGVGALASDALGAYSAIASKPTTKVIGNISSCMNIYDIRYVYLKVTETGNIKPGNLNAIYNYPSYYIGNSSGLSGYCELQDIQLSCAATEEEIEEIKTLLKGGVIF